MALDDRPILCYMCLDIFSLAYTGSLESLEAGQHKSANIPFRQGYQGQREFQIKCLFAFHKHSYENIQ